MKTPLDSNAFLTVRQHQALMHALARGQGPYSDEDLKDVLIWAVESLINSQALKMAWRGQADLCVRNHVVHITQMGHMSPSTPTARHPERCACAECLIQL